MKTFEFFDSAPLQREASFAKIRLLYIQNVVKWVVQKINQFCFSPQKAEMHPVYTVAVQQS